MGWFCIFILVPILMPMMLLGLYCLAPVQHEAGTKLIQQVKDGQLSWPACAFCASALYELAESADMVNRGSANWLQGAITCLLLVSTLVALLSVVFPTTLPEPKGCVPIFHFKMLLGSVVMVSLSASIYTWLHFSVTVSSLY
ncbi:hypothetical protein DES44_2737 [Roseateles depolymerans]|uniref:Uncharacterized protein n=2 Tax=Roseateles depolymerans TaxID=76731 RepID=A0A0U3LGN7_9BURK|nr:hypothetical protein RD2015_2782 [Roseateles depolymerans]REG20230.1 hypothetical protein DES44_2737 [Roseateles depolymerans]